MTCRRTKFKNYVDEEARRKNTTKSKVRAKVEHVFRSLKRVFGFDKVRYRGIAKNHNRLCACFAWSISTCIANAWPRSGRSASGGRKMAAPTLQIRSRTNHFRHRQSKTPQHQAPFAAAVQSNTCAGAP